jgi:ankyrin repeat protein
LTDNKKDSKNGLNILTDQNFYVNVRNKNGETALHLAASNNKDDLAKILIENEANVNAQVLYRTNCYRMIAVSTTLQVFNSYRQNYYDDD